MSNEARLAELGITLPPVTPPAYDYVPAIVHGGLVWISGQLPRAADGSLPHLGRLGEEVDVETARKAAELCALQALAALRAATGSLDNVARAIKLTGFVASAPGFNGQPAVVNGASEFLGEVFGDAGAHARSAVGVAELPLDAPVEVELIVEVK
jgi:enamine deaminase RidA (YjgF/YER057c/UK114 family)